MPQGKTIRHVKKVILFHFFPSRVPFHFLASRKDNTMRTKTPTRTILAAFFGLLFSTLSQGQNIAVKIDAKDPDFDALPSPVVSIGKGKGFKPKDWFEMEVEFKAKARPEPKDGYIDRLTVTWYVAVKKRDGKGYWLLTKDVEHINVKLDEKLFSSVYISPNAYSRLTGSERPNKGDVQAVGGEFKYNGTVVGQFSTMSIKKGNPWWNSNSLARTDKFQLFNKNETPFKAFWYDRYAEIAPERR